MVVEWHWHAVVGRLSVWFQDGKQMEKWSLEGEAVVKFQFNTIRVKLCVFVSM